MHFLQQFKQYLKPMDWIVLIIAFLIIIWLYANYWQQSRADYVLITSPSGVQKVNLHQTQTLSIKGKLGYSQLEIKQGKIRFVNSPCQKHYCVHAGWQQSGGAFAACLPNHILLEVQSEQFDAISY